MSTTYLTWVTLLDAFYPLMCLLVTSDKLDTTLSTLVVQMSMALLLRRRLRKKRRPAKRFVTTTTLFIKAFTIGLIVTSTSLDAHLPKSTLKSLRIFSTIFTVKRELWKRLLISNSVLLVTPSWLIDLFMEHAIMLVVELLEQKEINAMLVESSLTRPNSWIPIVKCATLLLSLDSLSTSTSIFLRWLVSLLNGWLRLKLKVTGLQMPPNSLTISWREDYLKDALLVILSGEPLCLLRNMLTRYSTFGLMLLLVTFPLLLTTVMSGNSGGRTKKTLSSTSSWEKIT